MLISKIEPSENGVYVGGAVNALLSLVKQLGRDGNTVSVLTSLASKKVSLFRKYQPKGAEYTIFRNNCQPQSVMFGFVFFFDNISLDVVQGA